MEAWARFAAILMFFGFNFTFLPQFMVGNPRRYRVSSPEFQIYHVMSTIGHGPRRGPSSAADLFFLVMVSRRACRVEPMGCDRIRVADVLAATAAQFRGAPAHSEAPLRLPRCRRRTRVPAPRPAGGDLSSETEIAAPSRALGRLCRADRCRALRICIASESPSSGAFFRDFAYLRILHPQAFAEASRHTELVFGATNTLLLLTSSFTLSRAASAAEFSMRRLAVGFLWTTAALGAAFLVAQGFEYHADFTGGLWPGPDFEVARPAAQLYFAAY